MFCLPKFLADDFLAKLKTGEITPDKLASMTSQQRREYFTSFLGEENAKNVNTLYESKILLKDQQRGIITWARQTAGLSKKAEKDIINRVNKMASALNPANQDAFLEDIVAHKLGVTVTMEQAGDISLLAKKTAEKRMAMEASERRKIGEKQTPAEKEYGDARVAFSNYISHLKSNSENMTFADYFKWQSWENALTKLGKGATDIAGLAKSMKASLDNSALLRQGLKILFTHPTIWYKNSVQSFIDIVKTLKGEDVLDVVNSDIVSRPTYDNMLKDKVAIQVMEEAFPTHLPSKIPVLGKLFKASEVAYTAFMQRNRADLYDLYTEIALKSGIKETTGIGLGKLVNSLTSRGQLGRLEPVAGVVNNIFFSPRNVKANWDVLTAHALSKDMSGFARKQAAINLLKIVSGIAGILTLAKAVDDDSVEWDAKSTDFGKIKVGDTRFDVSGGLSGLVVLARRLATMSSKSSTSGKTVDLWSKNPYDQSGKDVVYNFFENKFSPATRLALDLLSGTDIKGKKISVGGELSQFIMPLPIATFQELQSNPNSADIILAIILEELGVSTNTYSKKSKVSKGF